MLGEGGMGIVYAAYDDELDRKIAIKLVRAERVDDLARARVLREAQALARVSHPNVVQIYEVGVHGEQVYVAMEFVAGPTLAQWTTAQAWPAILARYLEAGRGLAAAHAAGLVHRDFKPANAIVGDDGRVRVLDFGIARTIAGAPARLPSESEAAWAIRSDSPNQTTQGTTLTQTGAMVGTPAYMSLEQFEGGDVDARSDQFSFCVALWEALYGARPFEGRTPAALIQAMRGDSIQTPTGTSGVPVWLRERIRRGLASEPELRWPTMQALLDALADDPHRRRHARVRRSAIVLLGLTLLIGSLVFARDQMASADRAERDRALALAEEAAAREREAAAEAERDRALDEARASALRARDIARIVAARSLTRDPTLAVALLREVENPDGAGWRSVALEVLARPVSRWVIAEHEDRVVDLEYSPDGEWLASASFDGRVRLWPSAALGQGHYYVLAHDDRVFDISFDRSSTRLVSSSKDNSARVWTLPDAAPTRSDQPLEPSHVLRGSDAIVWTARFSPTGDRVVTASRDGTVAVWRLAGEREPEPIQRQRPWGDVIAWHAEFSPEGHAVAIATNDGGVYLWDLEQDQVRELSRHTNVAWVAHFSPDGRWVASASQSGELRIDPVDPELHGRGTPLRGHTGPVQRAGYSPDGRWLASCSHDSTARLWPLDEQGRPNGPARVIDTNKLFALAPTFSPDSRWLAIGGVAPTVRVVEVAGGQPIELSGHSSEVFSLDFSPDGSRLATGSYDRTVRIWDTHWSQVERRFDGDAAPNPTGRWLIEHRDHEPARLWRITPEQVLARGSTAEPVVTNSYSQAWARVDGTDWLVLANERDELLGYEIDERIVDERDLVPRWRIASTGPRVGLHLSAEGRWLLVGTAAGQALLWHFAEGLAAGPHPVPLDDAQTFTHPLSVLGLGNGGRTLVSTSIRGHVRITALDPDRGVVGESRLYPGVDGGRNNGILFDPDGRWVAVSALDRSVRIWTLDSLESPPLSVMLASEARSIAYDARLGRLLLGCGDGVIRSLDPDTGEVAEVTRVEGNPLGLDLAVHRPWLAISTESVLHLDDAQAEPLTWMIERGIRRVDFVGEDRRLLVSDVHRVQQLMPLGERIDTEGLRARLRAASDYCPSVDERVRYAGESPELAARDCELRAQPTE